MANGTDTQQLNMGPGVPDVSGDPYELETAQDRDALRQRHQQNMMLGLLAAGLGTLAARGRYGGAPPLGQALGEGGLAGLQVYGGAEQAAATEQDQRERMRQDWQLRTLNSMNQREGRRIQQESLEARVQANKDAAADRKQIHKETLAAQEQGRQENIAARLQMAQMADATRRQSIAESMQMKMMMQQSMNDYHLGIMNLNKNQDQIKNQMTFDKSVDALQKQMIGINQLIANGDPSVQSRLDSWNSSAKSLVFQAKRFGLDYPDEFEGVKKFKDIPGLIQTWTGGRFGSPKQQLVTEPSATPNAGPGSAGGAPPAKGGPVVGSGPKLPKAPKNLWGKRVHLDGMLYDIDNQGNPTPVSPNG